MPVSRKKRTVEQPIETDDSIFTALGVDDPTEKGKKDAPPQSSDEVTALKAQLEELNRRLTEGEDARLALITNQVKVEAPDNTPKAPVVDLKGLPDPLTETEAYNTALAERVSAAIAQGNAQFHAQQRQAASYENNADALFEDFSEKYPLYSDNEDRIAFVAQKVAQRAQSRNIDVQKYMFVTSDKFFRDVVKEYDGIFGKPVEESDEDEGENEDTRVINTKNIPAEDDDGRDTSIPGGQAPGQRVNTQLKQGDMIKDLADLQRASGFF